MRNFLIIVVVWMVSFAGVSPGYCLTGDDIIMLKSAGISSHTIETLATEKAVETGAFSVSEIIKMKRAGVSEETLRVLIENSSFIRNISTRSYGKDVRPLHLKTVEDIIRLHNSGLGEEIIRAVIVYGNHSENDVEKEKAWKMLEKMGVVVDER
jgi:hypothetical protein